MIWVDFKNIIRQFSDKDLFTEIHEDENVVG